MMYGGQLQGMPPKLKAKNFPGMELIRPLYTVREDDICASVWQKNDKRLCSKDTVLRLR